MCRVFVASMWSAGQGVGMWHGGYGGGDQRETIRGPRACK